MSSTTDNWGGLNAVELGLVIGACGVGMLLIIILITVCCIASTKSKKKTAKQKSHQGMVKMQTSRTVNGKNMQQVIIKNPPNGNQERDNQNNIPYRTMDPETHTVRYDTATHSYPAQEEVLITFHDNEGHDTKVITKADTEEIDSGTGASPTRTSAVIHEGETNAGFMREDDNNTPAQEEVQPYGYYVPPPPVSQPPPLTPGTPVTDLDADDDQHLPPPPPTNDYTYAAVDRNRNTRPSSSHVEPSPSPPSSAAPTPPPPARQDDNTDDYMKQVYRSPHEIQIIEKSTF